VDFDEGRVRKILKVVVVGEMGTGRSSLIRQYAQGLFSDFYKGTIGVDFVNKDFDWDDHTSISLQLWDIAGQERYGSMTSVYYQGAVAAWVGCDVTRVATLDVAWEWKKDIDQKAFTSAGDPIPGLLLGNKIDECQDGRWGRTAEEMQKYIDAYGFIGFFTTSSRDDRNLDEAVRTLVRYVLEHKIEPYCAIDDKEVDLITHPRIERSCGLY
jgi:small GTP-binding protein